MGVYSFPASAIVDSTATGRSLITAANAAAARSTLALDVGDSPTFATVTAATMSSVDGVFSGTLDTSVGGSIRAFDLGSDADVATGDTRYIEYSSTGLQQLKTGAAAAAAWTIGSTTLAGIEFAANGTSMMLESNFGQNIKVADGYSSFGQQVFPRLNDTYPLGTTSFRWSNVASVDGSFSGTLDTEVGGSTRIFNLGSDADVAAGNTEYLDTRWSSNELLMTTKNTGTGVDRVMRIGNTAAGGNLTLQPSGEAQLKYASSTKLAWGSTYVYVSSNFYPSATDAYSSGRTGNRWSTVFGVDGDFSGTVTATETFLINTTWNDASTVFQAFDANITDTASNVNSNLLNLKVGGVQKFRVKKDGAVTATSFTGDGSGLTGLPSGSSTLAGLTDTNVSSPANGQLLIYDAVSSKWDSASLASAGGTISFTAGGGTLNLETAGGAPSDERLKKDINPIEGSLEKVMAMKPVEFEWRDGYDEFHKAIGKDIGFVAQQIEQVEPLLVGERGEFLTLEYAKFAPILVGAIQELKAEIERLKKKVGEL